jgi:spermidine synthase
MKTVASQRQPHAVLDLPSRNCKGLKIERLLEIGTGSGGIAHYFATHPTLHCEVTAVEVVDQAIEGAHGPGARLARRLPDAPIAGMRRVIRTLICRIEHQPA